MHYMRLGLVTDIHEDADQLRLALSCFAEESVDQVVVIGDVCEMGARLEETCRLLKEAKAIGVWGNHDYGLCVNPDDEAQSRFGGAVIDFMTSLRPRLDVAGCHFRTSNRG
jgi:predicted phosphodiesterase